MAARRVTFGPYVFDLDQGSLMRDGRPLAIGQYGVALLDALLAADGQTVSREALIARAWPGSIVEDGNLTVQIAALRRILGERADGADWIATVPRRGYRLPVDDTGGRGAYPPIIRPSLAVLPFTNLTGDPGQEYFVDGIVEDITTALSRFKSFGVVARNSSFVYKGRAVDVRQVAKELGVRYVLEGSFRRNSERQRVTAQLVDADSSEHVWARNFDSLPDRIFDVQDRIVEDVASLVDNHVLQAELKRARLKRLESLDAYDLYLRALADLRTARTDLRANAFAMLMRVLAIDPGYAPALAKATSALLQSKDSFTPLTDNDRELCLELSERGLAAADGDATVMAQCALGLIGFRHYDRGVRAIREAFRANPNDVVVIYHAGIVELHFGSVEESVALYDRALRIAEGTFHAQGPLMGLAHAHIVLGNFEEARAAAERSYAINPNSFVTHWMLIAANAHLGLIDEAKKWLAGLQRLTPGITIGGLRAAQAEKIPGRMSPIYEGLRLAGLPES